jgi:phosphomannomutase
LGALAGLTGAATLVNRRLRTTSALPLDHVGGVRRPWHWRGYNIFATEMGAGPTILMVHGIYAGASSFEFRKLVPSLARTNRVVAFDLLGCGLSELPDLDYSAELFVEMIVDAIGEFTDGPMTLLGSSLGGAFAVRAATRAPDRVKDLILIAPTGLGVLDTDPSPAQRAITMLFRSPIAGESAFNGLASRPSLGWFLRNQSYADPASVTPEIIDHYYAVTHQAGARFVPAHFVGGALNCNVANDLPFVEAPVLVLWGERASKTNPLERSYEYARLAKNGRLATFANSGLIPHEEEPEAVAATIVAFLSDPNVDRSRPAPAPQSVASSNGAVAPAAAEPQPVAQSQAAQAGEHAVAADDAEREAPADAAVPQGAAQTETAADAAPESTAVTPEAAAEADIAAAGLAQPVPEAPPKRLPGEDDLPSPLVDPVNPGALGTIFKSYDVRGIFPTELDEATAYAIGRSFVAEFGVASMGIGRDMRPSGTRLFEALARGAAEAGANVTDVGLVSTDALYFAVGRYGFGGGIMITASHNPANYNGMKFTRDKAQAISLDTGLGAIRDRLARGDLGPLAERIGRLERWEVLDDFAEHCLTFVDRKTIKPFKIAIDAGNGMAGLTVPHVFKHLPCRVVPLFFELDGTFPNHPASPIEPENMVDLQRAVIENQCDLGVAFDGDADRMFIVDEKGGLVGGDMVTALVGINTLKRNPGAKILYNLICSRSTPEAIEKAGGVPVRSQVGHSIIKKVMRDENIVFGGEHSGHFYFRDNWFADSGMIALLQCLEVFSDAGKPVSEVVAPIDHRSRSGEINSHVRDIPAKLRELEEHYKDAQIDHLDGVTIQYPDWWMNVRPSNTEPLLRLNVEGDTRELMERHRDEALALIRR